MLITHLLYFMKRRPLYNFLKRREDKKPGFIAEEATTVSRTSLITSLGAAMLSTRFGTEISTVTSAITAAGSAYALLAANRVLQDIDYPADFRPRETTEAEAVYTSPLTFDIAGGLLLTSGAQLTASATEYISGNEDRLFSVASGLSMAVIAAGTMLFTIRHSPVLTAAPKVLTEEPQSDTIG
jgi:hypothetical protein